MCARVKEPYIYLVFISAAVPTGIVTSIWVYAIFYPEITIFRAVLARSVFLNVFPRNLRNIHNGLQGKFVPVVTGVKKISRIYTEMMKILEFYADYFASPSDHLLRRFLQLSPAFSL